MILLIDNYDSFALNLARYLRLLGQTVEVVRNDAVDAATIARCKPQAVVISPGPCAPQQAGCCLEVIRELHTRVPMLGVCLGHQAICEALGGQVVRSPEPMHGRASAVFHHGHGLFRGLPSPFMACRYHSLVVAEDHLPDCLEVAARTAEGILMAVSHRQYPVFGLQFHPESILTEHGFSLLAAFLGAAGLPARTDAATPESLYRRERDELRPLDRPLPQQPVTF